MGSKPICVLGLFYHDLFVEIQVYFQSHISIKYTGSANVSLPDNMEFKE